MTEVLLGTTDLTRVHDLDDVRSPVLATTVVNALQLRVSNATAEIDRVDVEYADGSHEVVLRDAVIAPGTTSAWLPLKKPGALKEVEVSGNTEGAAAAKIKGHTHAVVEIYAH